MRLFLIPIARNRTLLYCKRHELPPLQLPKPSSSSSTTTTTTTTSLSQSHNHNHHRDLNDQQPSLSQPPLSFQDKLHQWHERAQANVTAKWSQWEGQRPGSWKQSLTGWGNRMLQRIPYQEWALKSVPPLAYLKRLGVDIDVDRSFATKNRGRKTTASAPATANGATDPAAFTVEVVYPGNIIQANSVLSVVRRLATERIGLHRRKIWWSVAATPITLPLVIIPLVPNIPLFYLVYRAWSHWRALSGSKHLQFLLDHDMLTPTSPAVLEDVYKSHSQCITNSHSEDGDQNTVPSLLIREEDGKTLAKILDAPELASEVQRAVLQVRNEANERKSG